MALAALAALLECKETLAAIQYFQIFQHLEADLDMQELRADMEGKHTTQKLEMVALVAQVAMEEAVVQAAAEAAAEVAETLDIAAAITVAEEAEEADMEGVDTMEVQILQATQVPLQAGLPLLVLLGPQEKMVNLFQIYRNSCIHLVKGLDI